MTPLLEGGGSLLESGTTAFTMLGLLRDAKVPALCCGRGGGRYGAVVSDMKAAGGMAAVADSPAGVA